MKNLNNKSAKNSSSFASTKSAALRVYTLTEVLNRAFQIVLQTKNNYHKEALRYAINEMEFSFYSAYLNADKTNFERSCETNAKIRYRGFDAFPKFSSNRRRIIYAAIRVYEAHHSGAWLLNGFFGWE